MIPIEDFLEGWINGQVRKFRAEIEVWETAQEVNIYACDFCSLELDDCDCGGCE